MSATIKLRLSLTQLLLGVVLLLGLLSWLGVAVSGRLAERDAPTPGHAARPPTVQVAQLHTQPLLERRIYRGSVEAESRSVLSARLSAEVVAVYHREGEHVQAGQLLVQLDDRELRQEQERLAAVASRLASELALARREMARQEELFQRQHTAERLLDEARQRVETLNSQIRENQAARELTQTRLGYTEERAPFAGIISRVDIHEGEWVNPGRAMLELIALDRLKAVLAVPQQDVARLSRGQAVQLLIDGWEMPWQSSVARVYPTLEQRSRQATVAAYFPDTPGAAGQPLPWPGMAVRGSVELAAHPQAVQVPIHTVRRQAGQSWVYVLEEDIARRRDVSVAGSQEGLIHVVEGLQAGGLLITNADPRLADGVKVDVRDELADGNDD